MFKKATSLIEGQRVIHNNEVMRVHQKLMTFDGTTYLSLIDADGEFHELTVEDGGAVQVP